MNCAVGVCSSPVHCLHIGRCFSTPSNHLHVSQLFAALGWQGGTYQQALAAVKRHREALDQIAERTGSEDPCRPLVQIARAALARTS